MVLFFKVFEATAVDYGDVVFVRLANLQPLSRQFRNLPVMSIKVKLAGLDYIS